MVDFFLQKSTAGDKTKKAVRNAFILTQIYYGVNGGKGREHTTCEIVGEDCVQGITEFIACLYDFQILNELFLFPADEIIDLCSRFEFKTFETFTAILTSKKEASYALGYGKANIKESIEKIRKNLDNKPVSLEDYVSFFSL